MEQLEFQAELLAAAIAHAKEFAHGPRQRKDVALFFLRCELQSLVKQRLYPEALYARNLIAMCVRSMTLQSLLETFLAALEGNKAAGPTL